jgi:hypothetical protein
MRCRSITTLCLFGAAAFVALKYPLIGFGICICCLIVYLLSNGLGHGTHHHCGIIRIIALLALACATGVSERPQARTQNNVTRALAVAGRGCGVRNRTAADYYRGQARRRMNNIKNLGSKSVVGVRFGKCGSPTSPSGRLSG